MHSKQVWSLNLDITTSLRLRLATIFLNSTLQPAQAQQCKGGPICPFTAYQGAETLYKHMTWMWDALHEGLEPQP